MESVDPCWNHHITKPVVLNFYFNSKKGKVLDFHNDEEEYRLNVHLETYNNQHGIYLQLYGDRFRSLTFDNIKNSIKYSNVFNDVILPSMIHCVNLKQLKLIKCNANINILNTYVNNPPLSLQELRLVNCKKISYNALSQFFPNIENLEIINAEMNTEEEQSYTIEWKNTTFKNIYISLDSSKVYYISTTIALYLKLQYQDHYFVYQTATEHDLIFKTVTKSKFKEECNDDYTSILNIECFTVETLMVGFSGEDIYVPLSFE